MDQTFGKREVSGTVGDGDTELLAQLIFYEGRGYESHVKELIGQVAVNRVKSPKFPDTLAEVVLQDGQYACAELIADHEVSDYPGYTAEVWESCMAAAKRVINGTTRDENGDRWPENVLYQHSFSDPMANGPLFRSYTDESGIYTEHFNFG